MWKHPKPPAQGPLEDSMPAGWEEDIWHGTASRPSRHQIGMIIPEASSVGVNMLKNHVPTTRFV